MRVTTFLLATILLCSAAMAQTSSSGGLRIIDSPQAASVDGTEKLATDKTVTLSGNRVRPTHITVQQLLDAGLDAILGDVVITNADIENATVTLSFVSAGIMTIATATITDGTVTTLATSNFTISGVPLDATQVAVLTDSDGDVDIADGQHTHEGLGATAFTIYDRSPGVWESDSDTFSTTFAHNVWQMGDITVSNWPFPKVATAYAIDATGVITGMTLSRTAAVTAESDEDDLVEWSYVTADALTFLADFDGNLLMGPDGAVLLGEY